MIFTILYLRLQGKMLSLQFIPNKEIAKLDSDKKISIILNLVKKENIVLLEGKLSKTEETELIKRTMEEIKGKFKGIEIATIFETENKLFVDKIKQIFVNLILRNKAGFTIIGPASIIKEIKKNPNKIQLLTVDKRIRRKRRKKKK